MFASKALPMLGAAALMTALFATGIQAQTGAVCGQRVLNVVAHHDDDLLFLSPDLLQHITNGNCVRTVFLVASDYHDQRYLEARELGIREAYAFAANLSPSGWQSGPYSAGGTAATLYTLGSKLSIVELRISDNLASDGALWRLLAEDTPLMTRQGVANPPQRLTRESLRLFLRALADDYGADVVNTVNPIADQDPLIRPIDMPYHPDHVATARFVAWAYPDRTVQYYDDYSIVDLPENVSGDLLTLKLRAFAKFGVHDSDMCAASEGDSCPRRADSNAFPYPSWLRRQYRFNWGWPGSLVVPLPKSSRSGPYMDGTYVLANIADKTLALTAPGAAAPGQPLTVAANTGAPTQAWRFEVIQEGWRLRNVGTGLCLALPASSQGTAAVQAECGGDLGQAVRVEKGWVGGFKLRIGSAGSTLALTPGNGAGSTVTLQSGGIDQKQEWEPTPVCVS